MMRHYFFAPSEIQSPRWEIAFQSSRIIGTRSDFPHDLANSICWCHETLLDEKCLQTLLSSGAKIVVLVNAEQPSLAKYWLEKGANGYLHYGAAPELLQSVAQVVSLGGVWMGADLLRAIVQSVYSAKNQNESKELTAAQLQQLSIRELQVAKLVSQGQTNKEIARFMDISERTVKAHLSAVFEKLNLRDRLQLALVMPKG